jgi:hypothetical protein
MLARQVAQGSEVCAMNKDVAAEGSSMETFFNAGEGAGTNAILPLLSKCHCKIFYQI